MQEADTCSQVRMGKQHALRIVAQKPVSHRRPRPHPTGPAAAAPPHQLLAAHGVQAALHVQPLPVVAVLARPRAAVPRQLAGRGRDVHLRAGMGRRALSGGASWAAAGAGGEASQARAGSRASRHAAGWRVLPRTCSVFSWISRSLRGRGGQAWAGGWHEGLGLMKCVGQQPACAVQQARPAHAHPPCRPSSAPQAPLLLQALLLAEVVGVEAGVGGHALAAAAHAVAQALAQPAVRVRRAAAARTEVLRAVRAGGACGAVGHGRLVGRAGVGRGAWLPRAAGAAAPRLARRRLLPARRGAAWARTGGAGRVRAGRARAARANLGGRGGFGGRATPRAKASSRGRRGRVTAGVRLQSGRRQCACERMRNGPSGCSKVAVTVHAPARQHAR